MPEAMGGLGLGLFDAALLMEQAGRTLVSGPLAEAIVAARLLALLDPDDATGLRNGIASGASVATLAFHDVAVAPDQLVAGGAVANAVIVRDGDAVVLVRPGRQQAERTLASTPIARLTLSGVERTVLGRGAEAIALHAAAVEEWKLLTASALAGLSVEAIRIASAYACEREQFGRPIGSYQGVSHPLADAVVEVDAGRLMLWRAIRAAVDGDADAGERVSIAAWWAGQAAEKAVVRALHTHGGYGLTLEYDIHLFNLRSRAWLLVLGDPELLLEEAARRRYRGEIAKLPDAGAMNVEYGLGDEAEALARETRDFFEATLTPELRAKAHYSYGGHDPGVHRKLAEAGLLYPDWPERIGGRGVSTYAMQAAHKVWEDYDWTSHPHGTTNIIGLMIDRFGTDQCKADILSRIISGDIICSLGYSEPGSGSDVFAAKTRATRQADGSWRIDGQKMFTSGAEHGDYVIMLARTDPEAPKHKGVSMFMVPLNVPGVTIQEVKTFQDERTNITYYDGVLIPDAYRLGEINGGLAVMSLALEIEQGMSFGPYQERLLHAAERLCGKAMRHGRPAIEDPAVQLRLTRVWANAIASQCLHDRILWVTAEGKQNLAYGPAVKLFSAEAYRADAFDLLSLTAPESLAFADKDAAFINQCYRHSQVATVYGGTSEVQRSQVAEKQLGLPRTR
ncbi:acyl-CoA dehydrogenase family protein [Novosphingobium sp. G106]|uniref:acyl-CoA dehydrogenase family protein n=1 Tax=Novosphingobium sp. G106 TaxID=2849500 RepID=UPI002811F82A|nr:acyl-CoA dehydrogenase family protein [Novosphingobium sp. G106]